MTIEGYDGGLLKYISVVAGKRKIGGDEGSGTVWPGGSFEGDSDSNFEGVGPREGDPLSILEGT